LELAQLRPDYWAEVSGLPAFSNAVRELTIRSVARSMTSVVRSSESLVDWRKSLLLASLVTPDANDQAFDGAVRIAQGCLQSEEASSIQKAAASSLLQALGNHRAVTLATEKGLILEILEPPLPVQIDMIRSGLERAILLNDGAILEGNDFQRKFWSAASKSRWVSASAPTSAGKSFIVKRWFESELKRHESLTTAYIVPTRALIEEVSAELTEDFAGLATVFTMPWDKEVGNSKRSVFVLTQERLHILQQSNSDFTAKLLFIDEAQKFGDDSRGILLQRVLDENIRRDPGAQVLFASPSASNPEILLSGSPETSEQVSSSMITVNQNLIYVDQVPRFPQRWLASVSVAGSMEVVGEFSIPSRPTSLSKRLAYTAVALGYESQGNLVYANGAAEAEKLAELIYTSLGPAADVSDDPDIVELQRLVERTIHPQYALHTHIQRGVAFHYGNMPLLLREEIERLFRKGTIRYLICTSTLLEGVNLPCQNLFVRAPRKGNAKPMSVADFWNLAGRAGRWGIEFQGNIVCVDATKKDAWVNLPKRKERMAITRSTDISSTQFGVLMDYVRRGTPLMLGTADRSLEALFSLLALTVGRQEPLSNLPWLQLLPDQMNTLEVAVRTALEPVEVDLTTRSRHAGISPISMQRLLDWFRQFVTPINLGLPLPEANEAWRGYSSAIGVINNLLGGTVGDSPRRHNQLAVLLVGWMRGLPLARLIDARVSYARNNRDDFSLPRVIREVMSDVEQFARFEAPTYLACYQDLLLQAFPLEGEIESPLGAPHDIAMMLELGVSRTTELSMMSLGLSRTSAVLLGESIPQDEFSQTDVIEWIESGVLDRLDLPAAVVNEALNAIERRKRTRPA
jgi:hypothetical protein